VFTAATKAGLKKINNKSCPSQCSALSPAILGAAGQSNVYPLCLKALAPFSE
jgi:hypothetical protein